MNRYQQKKEEARQEAINWQHEFSQHNYSYSELADWGDYFTKLGCRFGLLKEFRENAII